MKSFPSLPIAVLCAALLCAPSILTAQSSDASGSNPLDFVVPKSKVLIGPVIGANRNFHTGGFRTIDEPNCPIFESGTGWGFLAGLGAEFQFGESWSIISRVMYESRPGSFQQTLPDALVLLPNETTPVNQTVEANSSITYSLLNAEVLYKQELPPFLGKTRLAVAAGPAFQYVLGGKNLQTQDLIEPENARFINPTNLEEAKSGRQLIFFNNDIPNRNSIRFSLKAGLQAEIGLFGNAWIMTPGVYYDFGLTDVSQGENWRVSSFVGMVDFRRAF